MKIGIDITNFNPAVKIGVNRYTLNLVRAMLQVEGTHEIRFYIARPKGLVREEELGAIRECFPGVPVSVAFDGLPTYLPSELNTARRLRLSGLLAPADRVARRGYEWFNRSTSAWVSRLRKACAEAPLIEEPDVMHHTWLVHYPFRRRASVLTICDLIPLLFRRWYGPELGAAYRPAFRFARRCAAVIAISEHTRQDVHRLLKVPLERIHAVPLAADEVFRVVDDRARVAERLAQYELAGRSFLLYAGSLEPRKNLPALVRAYARLAGPPAGPRPLLVLAGAKGYYGAPIFREIERLGLSDCVRHIENADDTTLVALMNAATALVYPSLYEGFGLPPLEAMACGCPVIASNASSLPEVVGDAGILVDPRDEEALAGAMARLIQDAGLREELRRRGLRRCGAFSWERTARLTLEVYSQAARGNSFLDCRHEDRD